MGFVGRTVQIVSLVCELLALLLVLAAAAVFVFCVDETNSSGAASTTADRREKVSRKWEKVQLFVLQKRRKQLNTRLITHQALLLCAMAMFVLWLEYIRCAATRMCALAGISSLEKSLGTVNWPGIWLGHS